MYNFHKIITAFKFLFRDRLEIASDLINTSIKDFEFQLTPKDVLNYNEAVENGDESAVKATLHPLYYTKISWRIIENLNDYLENKIQKKILKSIVHLSEYLIFYKNLDPSAKLLVKSKIWTLEPHKKGTKMITRFDYYSNKELVASEYSTGLLYGVNCIGDKQSHGEIDEQKRINNQVIWEEELKIDRDLPFKYAKKAEIDAPIHTDPKFAKSLGLPDIILQGTCTFAKSVGMLLLKELDDDATKIKSVSAKFTGMVVPPNQIRVRLLKRDTDCLYFDVLNNKGQTVIKGGQIEYK